MNLDATVHAKIMDMLLDTICVVDEDGRFMYVSASSEKLLGYRPEELLGRNMIELVHPEDRERTLAAADEIMAGEEKPHFENRYIRKDGSIVHIMWSARWSMSDRLRIAVARDVTEVRRVARLKSALYQISEAAHAAESLAVLYRKIHKIIAELLPAESFCVALCDPESADGVLEFPYWADARAAAPGRRTTASADAHLNEVIRSGRPLLACVLRCTEHADGTPNADWLGAPLISQGRVMGALAVRTRTPGLRYTEENRDLLQFVSTQIATAIERKRAQTQLQHMAGHDPLTGLPNRMLFQDRLEAALRRAQRDSERLALLYLDLDGFKEINDSLGHETGDRMLCEVAQRLTGCVRAQDTVGRMGGDEFTVLLPNIGGKADVHELVAKVRSMLMRPLELDGRVHRVGASIGAAVYPDQAFDGEHLMRLADKAMYAQKRYDDHASRTV